MCREAEAEATLTNAVKATIAMPLRPTRLTRFKTLSFSHAFWPVRSGLPLPQGDITHTFTPIKLFCAIRRLLG
jgi:hypothetical protein